MKRLAILLCFTLLLALPTMVFASEETTVIIHYKPAADNTLDWNLWIWPDGGEGSVYHFDGEDDFGKVATVKLSGNHTKVGFIVRTDAWEKDVDADRFVEVSGGSAEIWLLSGDATIYTSNPDGGETAEATTPEAMPKTGMGGTSQSSYVWSLTALLLIALASFFFIRKQRVS